MFRLGVRKIRLLCSRTATRRGDSPLHDCSCAAFLELPFFFLHNTRVIKDYLNKASFDVGEEKWQMGCPRSMLIAVSTGHPDQAQASLRRGHRTRSLV